MDVVEPCRICQYGCDRTLRDLTGFVRLDVIDLCTNHNINLHINRDSAQVEH